MMKKGYSYELKNDGQYRRPQHVVAVLRVKSLSRIAVQINFILTARSNDVVTGQGGLLVKIWACIWR
jgi:hypothetical protein